VWDFEFDGICATPTDVTLPGTLAYRNIAQNPAQFSGAALTINGVSSLIVRSWEFDYGRSRSQRMDGVTSTHAGFAPGDRDSTFTVTLEATPLSTFNPYSLQAAGTEMAVVFGTDQTTQYERWQFTLAQAQLTDVTESEDDKAMLWELTFKPNVSAPGQQDDVSLVWD
jgi:hypothetical protein